LKAAAALAVEVGSYSDPESLEGCAHFLEHMIFMGSHKYPKENEYDAFVSSSGGVCNAYTEGEYTVYHFDVNHSALPKALDIFANCILDPLLARDAVDREIKAIQNEFKLAVLDDDSRLQQVLSHQIRSDHVLHKFGWGNEQSLRVTPAESGVDAYASLVQFYRTYYQQALHKMTLCVVSGFSLDAMEEMVKTSFSPVAKEIEPVKTHAYSSDSKDASTASWPLPSHLAIPEVACRTLTRLVSIKKSHRLVLTWQIPSVSTEYRTKPAQYLGHILGHECPGSLIARLKARQWASKLVAGLGESNFEDNSQQGMLSVDIELTDTGLIHWIEVVALINTTLQHLRNYCIYGKKENSSNVGLPQWIFDEMQSLAQLAFDYTEEEEAEDIAERLAVQMLPLLKRKEEDFVAAPYLFFEWSSSILSQLLLDYMDISQAKIILMSRAFKSDDDKEDDDDMDDEEDDDDMDEDDDDDDDYSDDDDSYDDEDDEDDRDREILTKEHIGQFYDITAAASTTEYPFLTYILPPVDETMDSPSDEVIDKDLLREEPFFHVKYWDKPISNELYQYWQRKAEEEAETQASLPPRNPFVPKDLAILKSAEHIAGTSNEKKPLSKRPRLTSDNENGQVSGNACNACPPVDVLPLFADGKSWLYHCCDTRFHVPKVEVFVDIALPLPVEAQLDAFAQRHSSDRHGKKGASVSSRDLFVEEVVCRDILVSLSRDVLTSSAWYMAELAGLESEISSRPSSIVLSIRGFHDHALALLCTSLESILQLPGSEVDDILADELQLRRIVQDIVRKRYANALLTSQQLSQEQRLAHLMTDEVSSAERLSCLDRLLAPTSTGSTDHVISEIVLKIKAYRQRLCGAGEMHVMVHGNVSLENAQSLLSSLTTRLRHCASRNTNSSITTTTTATNASVGKKGKAKKQAVINNSAPSAPSFPQRLLSRSLPINTIPLAFQFARSSVEENTAIELYFQFPAILYASLHDPGSFGTVDIEEETYFTAWMALQLLELHWSEPFFDRLRSQLQLGYLVDCSLRETRNQLGICLRIVSATHSAPKLLQHIVDDFILKQLKELFPSSPSSTDNSFVATKLVENLLARKQQPDLSLGDASQRHWSLVEDRLLDWSNLATASDAKQVFTFRLRERQVAYLQQLLLLGGGASSDRAHSCMQREQLLQQHLLNVAQWLFVGDSNVSFAASQPATREFVALDGFLRSSLSGTGSGGLRLLLSIAMPRPSLSEGGEKEPDDESNNQKDDDESEGHSEEGSHNERDNSVSERDDDDDGDTEEGDGGGDEIVRKTTLKECQDILRNALASIVASTPIVSPDGKGKSRGKNNTKKANLGAKKRKLTFVTL
jgi:secreted Zn-dependent insulinase-like peptidase